MARNIQTYVLKELCKQNIDGLLPVLLEIYNEDLVWGDNSYEQENCYLRLVNDTQAVKYGGKKYLPCRFDMTMPEEDGKTLKPISLTVSSIDSRMIQLLRSTSLKSEVAIKACFAKEKTVVEGGKEKVRFAFYPLFNYKFKVKDANCTRITATLNLEVEDVLSLQASRDKATQDKFPSLKSES